jgi:hypothetical protein
MLTRGIVDRWRVVYRRRAVRGAPLAEMGPGTRRRSRAPIQAHLVSQHDLITSITLQTRQLK